MEQVHEIVKRLCVRIVENQDDAIMIVIKKVAGEEYRDITIDKHKTVDALRKSIAAPFTALVDNGIVAAGYCPNCGGSVEVEKTWTRRVRGACCSWCGQKLDVKKLFADF